MKKTALIIEDNPEIKENITELLELAGYNVITASDGKEGLTSAAAHLPDVILCDIMMPNLNGYEVLSEIKKNKQTSKIPFIYVTASAEKSELKKAMDLGADGYIRKPFDVKELMDVIAQQLEK